MALDGDTALVGADQGDKPGGQTVGRAYVFTRADGEWTQQARLAAEGGDSEFFGWAVALDGDTAVISARMTGPGRGEAYVFTRADGRVDAGDETHRERRRPRRPVRLVGGAPRRHGRRERARERGPER